MKHLNTIAILLFSAVIFFYSCNDKASSTKEKTTKPTITNSLNDLKEPAQNAKGIWHYTCSKGCKGGAGSAIKCASCGDLLTHNTAYHNKTNKATKNNNIATPIITPQNNQPAKEPAQNADGVWHYTCANGCSGGAGSAVACGSCGTTLAHNAAYH